MKRIVGIGLISVLITASVGWAALGGGDIVYKVRHVGDVTFSHDNHITDRGYKCDDCHPAIFPMEKRKDDKKRKMSDMRSKKACGVCHNGKNAFDVGSNCYICHKK